MDSANNDERIASILRRIIQLQSVRQIATQGVKHSACCFFTASIDLWVSNTSYSDELLRSMELLASTPGLRLRFVHFGLSNWDKSPGAFQQWARAITGSGEENDVVQSKGAGEIYVYGLRDDEEFAQLMASLASSKGVHSLSLLAELHRREHLSRAHRWAWLLHVLFNETSRHPVTSVDIKDQEIRLSDIDAIRSTTGVPSLNKEASDGETPKEPTPLKRRITTHPVKKLSLTLVGSYDAYAASKCRASSLKLTECEVHDQRSVFSFIRALEDPELAIPQTLRRLELHLRRSNSGGVQSLKLGNLWQYRDWNPASRWAWLIYTIFNPDARHSVTSVDITDREILLSDILAIQETCAPQRDATHSRQSQSTVGQMSGGYRVKTHRVTRLKLSLVGIRCMDDSEIGVKALLELVGWPLTHLSLYVDRPGLFDASHPNQVLQCCSNLTHLEINCLSLNSIHPILEAYTLNECNISSLKLVRCMISDPRSVLPFVEALHGPDSAVAKKLRHLELQPAANNGSMSDEVLMAFFSMLQVNQSLRRVVLCVSEDQRSRFQTRFDKLNGPIHLPLCLSSKYALLSVVKQMRSGAATEGQSTHAMGQLDRLLLGKIFAQAGENETRSVTLNSSRFVLFNRQHYRRSAFP